MKYKVTKYSQSCFLIEKGGSRVLIDPGNFVYELDGMKPEDWPTIHLMLVTHKHADHAHQPGLKFLVERDHCPLYTNQSFADELRSEGMAANVMYPGQTIQAGDFSIRGIDQKHGDLPPNWKPGPEDIGFVTDGIFYTPGDSLPLKNMPHADVLFVPVAGPQMSFDTARKMIEIVKPKLAIPMHFSNTVKYPIDLNDVKKFKVPGCSVRFLSDRQSFQWPEG